MSGVVIKIYSGVHLGAAIALKEGTWVFGRDDSADIIFADEGVAPRHAAITFSPGGIVRVEPLDGTVVMAGGAAPADGILPAASLWRLGPVLMAWGPEGADAEFWNEVEKSVLALISPAAAAAATEKPAEKPAEEGENPEEASAGEDKNEAEAEGGEAPAASEPDATAKNPKRICAIAGAGVLLLLIILSLLTFNDGVRRGTSVWLEAHAPACVHRAFDAAFETGGFGSLRRTLANAGLLGELPGPSTQEVEGILRESGFDGLKVTRADTGVYGITGMVANDRDRSKLVGIARGFEWPVVLDVAVESDYTDAYRSAFNSHGFWPNVYVIRTGESTDVTIAAYMISSVVEEKAFSDVANAVPSEAAFSSASGSAQPVRLVRRIRHHNDVRAVLDKAIADEKLRGVTVEYLPGTIRIKTTLTPDQKAKLDRAVEAARAACDVPLRMDVVNVTPKASAAPIVEKNSAQARKAERRAGPSFRVAAVSGGALKFVTLSDGTKVFQGGMLPGGYRLEAVHAAKLVLSKDKKRINYPLKVKK